MSIFQAVAFREGVVCAAVITSLCGCFYVTHDYYYASLEDVEDARVVKREKLSVKDLKGNSMIPTEYTITRKGYALNFLIGDAVRRAHFTISVHGSENTELSMEPKIDMARSSKHGISCANYYLDSNDPSTMRFVWDSNCVEKNIRKAITFDVVDASGAVVASEVIPFVLISDGKFHTIDAI